MSTLFLIPQSAPTLDTAFAPWFTRKVHEEHAKFPEADFETFMRGFVAGWFACVEAAERTPDNGFEQLNRYRKATAIVNVLDAWGYTGDVLLTFTAQQWGMIARAAEVRPPSQLTQALCLDLLRDREATRAEKKGGAA